MLLANAKHPEPDFVEAMRDKARAARAVGLQTIAAYLDEAAGEINRLRIGVPVAKYKNCEIPAAVAHALDGLLEGTATWRGTKWGVAIEFTPVSHLAGESSRGL